MYQNVETTQKFEFPLGSLFHLDKFSFQQIFTVV